MITNNFPKLESFVNRYDLQGPPSDESFVAVSGIAVAEGLDHTGLADMTEKQFLVLSLAAMGGTTEEVAVALFCSEDEITDTRDELLEQYGVPTMAAVVHRAIEDDVIPINKKRRSPDINPEGLLILNRIAAGKTNGEMGRGLRVPKSGIQARLTILFNKLRANGRTNSMLKSHEYSLDFSDEAVAVALTRSS